MKKTLLISVIVLMTSVIQGQVTNGLVAKYTFNNGNANDEIGINNGIVYGAHLTNDRFGNSNMAYSFNGVDDYIDCNTISYKLPITVTFWLKASTTNNQWKTVIGWNEPTTPYNGIQFYTTDNLKIAARIGDDTEDLVSNTVVCDGANWYFIAATRVDNNLELYINDVLNGTRSVSVGIGGPHNLFFGKSFRPSTYNEYLNGAIDDIRIYNRALNKDEIKSLFNETNPIKAGISDNSINNNRVDFFPILQRICYIFLSKQMFN